MGTPIWGKRANNYDVAELQVQTSPWKFKWGKSIQQFQRFVLQSLAKFLAHGQAHMGQMGKWSWQCTTTGLDNSTELRMEKIRQAFAEIWVPQVWQPLAARPPRPWRQYPSCPEGWGVKRKCQGHGQGQNLRHSVQLIDLCRQFIPETWQSHIWPWKFMVKIMACKVKIYSHIWCHILIPVWISNNMPRKVWS